MNELFCQTTVYIRIACWSVNADHSLQVSQKAGLVGHRVLQSELAVQTTGRPSMDRRQIDFADQSTDRAFSFRLIPEFVCSDFR
jgi:hypothetical protein